MLYDLKHLTGKEFIEKLDNFINCQDRPFYESSALKSVYDLKNVSDLLPIELYRYHFALFTMLYQLQDSYYKQNKYLHVHFMRSFLTNYPVNGCCREYDPATGLFCNTETENNSFLCPFHARKNDNVQLENSSLKYFYYSEENYYNLDETRAEAFINGTWELLFNYDQFKKSTELLSLPEKCTIEMVKTAYRKLAKMKHPDVNNGIVSEDFIQLNDAYQFLLKVLPSVDTQ